jgi:hypothetical protein
VGSGSPEQTWRSSSSSLLLLKSSRRSSCGSRCLRFRETTRRFHYLQRSNWWSYTLGLRRDQKVICGFCMKKLLLAILLLGLLACSRKRSDENVYSIASSQLPPEPVYGTSAYVQPPVVIPSGSGVSVHSSNAPLLQPSVIAGSSKVSPKLPPARRSSRKY